MRPYRWVYIWRSPALPTVTCYGVFTIGAQNADAVRSALEREGISLAHSDTGGSSGRTLRVYLDSGKTEVSQKERSANVGQGPWTPPIHPVRMLMFE